jgi:hypothetical protein
VPGFLLLLLKLYLALLGVGGHLDYLRDGAVLLGVLVHQVERHLGQPEKQPQHVRRLRTKNTRFDQYIIAKFNIELQFAYAS